MAMTSQVIAATKPLLRDPCDNDAEGADSPMPADQNLDRALRLLDETPLFDAHNDLPIVIRADKAAHGDVAAFRLDQRHEKGDTDIPRLREGRVGAQFWAAFVPPKEEKQASFALQQIALVHRMHAAFPEVFLPSFAAADVARAKNEGKIASFIAIENGGAIEGRLDALDAFYALGVRLITLCHASTHDWCDSATDAPRHNGLSDLGRDVIARMNDLGMIVDLAHVSDAVMNQVLDISRAPVVFSHSNARALCDHPRKVPDEILARIPGRDALIMATFVPNFICSGQQDWQASLDRAYGRATAPEEAATADAAAGKRPRGTLAQYCDHLDYLKLKVGPDHIGIGSDFFGGPQGEGLKDVACFPHIFAELIRRGWPDDDLRKLASENFLRVFRGVEAARRRQTLAPSC
jgi:membrane dipeptidase